ncbi:hypothetical protein D3C72_1246970 [compost metagenome]
MTKATTPPSASEPYSELAGPRTISTRLSVSRSVKLRLALENEPMLKLVGMAMPSVWMRTRLPSRPRMRMLPRPKRVALRLTDRPGS